MRSSTKTFVGLASIGIIAASAKFGLPTAAAVTNAESASSSNTSSQTPQPETTSPSTSTKTPTKSPAPTKKPSATTAPKPTATPTPKPSTGTSKTSGTISYKYGRIQVKVTKTGGKITSIDYLQASATEGRQAVFPDLVRAAIAANGSKFANIGQATFTTDAFKKALDNALGQF